PRERDHLRPRGEGAGRRRGRARGGLDARRACRRVPAREHLRAPLEARLRSVPRRGRRLDAGEVSGTLLFAVLILFGLFTGAAAGLLGVGGGIMMVPFLTLVASLPQHAAEATSLLVVLPTAI